jgi:hypothetical protein
MDTRRAPYDDSTDPAKLADPADLVELADDVSPAGRLVSVVAINAALVERILAHGARLRQEYGEAMITDQAYGGEMYRLVKAVRQANDLLVDRLVGRLPLSTPLVLVSPASFDAPVWRVGNQHNRLQVGGPPCP